MVANLTIATMFRCVKIIRHVPCAKEKHGRAAVNHVISGGGRSKLSNQGVGSFSSFPLSQCDHEPFRIN